MMRSFSISVIFLVFITIGCDYDSALEDFLQQESLDVEQLIGDWNREVTNGGWTNITPQTEGYEMTISFNSNRLFREYVDAKLKRETYYRIDTVVSAMDDKKLYKIYYFDGEREQRFVFDFVNEKSGLFLYDIGCFDCASTHAFSRITD